MLPRNPKKRIIPHKRDRPKQRDDKSAEQDVVGVDLNAEKGVGGCEDEFGEEADGEEEEGMVEGAKMALGGAETEHGCLVSVGGKEVG